MLRPLYSRGNNLKGPIDPLPFRLPTKLLYAFLIPATRATCPAHLLQLYCIILISYGIPFITTPNTTASPHRKPATAGIPRESWGAHDDKKKRPTYAECHKLWNYKLHTFNYPRNFLYVGGATAQGLGRLTVYVTQLRTHTHTVGLLWTSDQLVAEATTYKTHNKHNRRTSMPSVECEPTIPVI